MRSGLLAFRAFGMLGRKSAILIVVFGLLASLGAGYTAVKVFRDRTQTFNEFVGERVRNALVGRMQVINGQLHAIAGYMALDRIVSQNEFESFSRRLGLSDETRVLQFVRPVAGGDLKSYLENMNRSRPEGFSAFARTPGSGRKPLEGTGQHYIIELVSPITGNKEAIGLDVASNPVALKAIENAISGGGIAASSSFNLVQNRKERAFAIYLAIRDVSAEHPSGLRGIASAVIDSEALLTGLAMGNVQIVDAHSSLDSASLIAPRVATANTFPLTIDVPIADDVWTLDLAVAQQASPTLAGFIAFGLGALITLLGLAAQQQSNLQSRFRSIGRQLYESQQTLEEREAAYRALFDNAGSANVEIDWHDNRILRYNGAFLQLIGDRHDDISGRSILDFVDPSGHDEFLRHISGSVETEHASPVFECLISSGQPEPTWALVSVGSDLPHTNANGSACVVMQDMSDKKAADSARDLLVRELAHRVRNTMQLVASLAQQTARSSTTIDEYRDNLLGRLRALNSAQDVLFEANWGSVRLDHLANKVLSPFVIENQLDRLSTNVAPIMLSAQKSQTIALALHELASNAAQHGALSGPSGKVELDISVVEGDSVTNELDCLHLSWRESAPERCNVNSMRRGFGTIMLEKLLVQQHGGTSKFDWSSGNLVFEAELPLTDATG